MRNQHTQKRVEKKMKELHQKADVNDTGAVEVWTIEPKDIEEALSQYEEEVRGIIETAKGHTTESDAVVDSILLALRDNSK